MNREEILAMEAGNELDALVATEVMGWERKDYGYTIVYWEENDEDVHMVELWKPSTDIADAWKVVSEMRKRDIVTVLDNTCCEDCVSCIMETSSFLDIKEGDDGYVNVSSNNPAPLSICQAALLAVSNEM